jgi:CHU_C Type IX secretion signal domain
MQKTLFQILQIHILLGFTVTLMAQESMRNNGRIQMHKTSQMAFYGDLINEKSWDNNLGSVYFVGTALQTIEGITVPLQFEKVIMDNSNSLLLRVPLLNTAQLNFRKGIISTPRNTPSVNWAFGDTAKYIGASDTRHIYGYSSKIGLDSFAFPIGDGQRLRVAAIAGATTSSNFRAAYFKGDPSNAILPISAPFPITQLGTGLLGVSNYEYWDVSGQADTRITLTWNAQSQLVALTQNDISRLIVAGWNGSEWESLGTTSTVGDLSTVGSVTSNSVVPDTYKAYTFGVIKPQCVSNAPLLSLGNDGLLCPKDTMILAASDKYARYEWQDGSVDSLFMVTQAGQYWVKTWDVCGNSQTDTIEIGAGAGIEIATIPVLCAGDKNGAILLSDTTNVTIKINNFTRASYQIQALEKGSYDLTLLTPDGCRIDTLIEIKQENNNKVDIGRDTATIYVGDTLHLSAQLSAGFTPVSIKWSPPQYLSCTDCDNPIAKPTGTTTYKVEAVDSAGCIMTDEFKVFVNNKEGLYIPNAFNPEKEEFTILGTGNIVKVITMRIYDRWGTMLFEAADFQLNNGIGWNGYYRNQAMMRGTYVVALEIQFLNGDVKNFASEFLLSR